MSAKQHEPGHKAPAESGPPKPVFFESQQSHMEAAGVSAKRSRKASCVELPIHQASLLCGLRVVVMVKPLCSGTRP